MDKNTIRSQYRALPVQVRASVWFLVCSFFQKGITSITTPIFTRLMSTSEYGQFSVFNSWLSIVTIFITLNLSSGVYAQGLVKFSDDKKEYSSSMQCLTLTLVMFWTTIYLLFRSFWNQLFSLTTVQMLAMLVMIWTTSAFQFWAVEQRVELRYQQLIAVTVIVSLAKPIVSIFFVLHAQDKVTARILGLMLVELVFYTCLFFVQLFRGKRFFSKFFWKYALLFNLPLIPHYLSTSILSSSDRIMIDNMVGSAEAGIYNLAYSISQIMTLFTVALTQTLEPWLYKKIRDKQIDDIASVAYPAIIMIGIVNLVLMAFAPEIVIVFAPSEYYAAIGIIPPVAMSVYFMFMYSFFATFEFYYEKTRYVMLATSVAAVLNIILNFIFIQKFGYYAASYTTLVCYVAYALCHYCFMRRICNQNLNGMQPYNSHILLLLTACFLGLGFLFLMTYSYVWLRYLLIAVLVVVLLLNRNIIHKYMLELLSVRKTKHV